MLNRDGTFNVVRHGMPLLDFVHPYHRLLRISWTAFFAFAAGWYFAANIVFACAYLLCGPHGLEGAEASTTGERFVNAFFFSVQTLGTIGYGKITPRGLAANILVSIEALTGLLGFALITGILFARFSRPTTRIAFSDTAIMAPYRGGSALMFRIANARPNELSDVHATVSIAYFEQCGAQRVRRFQTLALERDSVTFLPTQWVVVHPIDASSPLAGLSERAFEESGAEILILLSAVDETFSQTVQSRSSYKHHEVVWGARFQDIQSVDAQGRVELDIRRLGEWERSALPPREESL